MATYTLGRDFDTPLKIEDEHKSVSHNHASFMIDGDNWTICDNDSTNGTYVEENGQFHRIKKTKITPETWIRLGEEGHRGFYFKARRIVKPNDYREDFAELYEVYQELESAKSKLDSNRRSVKFLTPGLMIAGLVLSFLPGIVDNPIAVRGAFMLPGFISPFIQDALLNNLEKKIKMLQQRLICPKCRRALGKDDILNRMHSLCHAH